MLSFAFGGEFLQSLTFPVRHFNSSYSPLYSCRWIGTEKIKHRFPCAVWKVRTIAQGAVILDSSMVVLIWWLNKAVLS